MKKSIKVTSFSILLNLCLFNVASAATMTADGKFAISGISAQRISSFTGTGSSINVDIGDGLVPSGDISFLLDETKTNLIYYNFDSGYTTLDIHILLDAPILDDIGEPPVSFNLIESAFIPAFNIVETSSLPRNTEFTYVSDGFISQPSLDTQETSFIGGGMIDAPEGNFATIELIDPPPILFIGGGVIESGIFTGFEYWNGNDSETTDKVIDIALEIVEEILEAIDEEPEPYPPNDPPEEAPTAPAFDPYPSLPFSPVQVVSVPEFSSNLSLLVFSIIGVASILRKKFK